MRVLIFGTFDLLHPGHKFVINESAKLGELHIVVARDTNVEKIKNQKPKQDENERLEVLKKKYPDAHVQLGDSDNFLKPVREIDPDLILLGYDQELPPGIEKEYLGCSIERLPAFEPDKWKSSLKRG
jgi:FAD synthetase